MVIRQITSHELFSKLLYRQIWVKICWIPICWIKQQTYSRQIFKLTNDLSLVFKHKCLDFCDIFTCFSGLRTSRAIFSVYLHFIIFKTIWKPLLRIVFPHNMVCVSCFHIKNVSAEIFPSNNKILQQTSQKTTN